MSEAPVADASAIQALLPFNPTTPEFRDDPYIAYEKCREEIGPVAKSPLGVGVYTVTGHAECVTALKDPRYGWGDGGMAEEHFAVEPDGTKIRQLNFMDPPDHTRIRGMCNYAFTPRRVNMLRGRAEQLLEDMLVKARAEDGPVDLVPIIASPLPALVLGDLIGVPPEDEPWFQKLCVAVERGLDLSVFLTPEQIAARDEARLVMYDYFDKIAEKRRVEPRDDLMSALVQAEDDGQKLTAAELRVNATLMLTAGYVTMVNFVGLGLHAMLRNPDQLSWLREHPDQVDRAVDEMLRYDGPAQMVGRVVLDETELGGHQLYPGDMTMLMVGAANRDPVVFDRPDELVFSRPANRGLGFGLGIHFCIGAPLARMINQVVIGRLLNVDLRLSDERPATFRESITIRGMAELPVHVGRDL
jgi:cytochrome P450